MTVHRPSSGRLGNRIRRTGPVGSSPCAGALPEVFADALDEPAGTAMGCPVLTGFILLGPLMLSLGASVWQKRLLLADVSPTQLWNQTYLSMLLPAILLVGVGLLSGLGGAVQNGFWLAASIAGALDALGNRAFGESLRRTDLSIFGPLNAFRPVLALGLGVVFLGERPPPRALGPLASLHWVRWDCFIVVRPQARVPAWIGSDWDGVWPGWGCRHWARW